MAAAVDAEAEDMAAAVAAGKKAVRVGTEYVAAACILHMVAVVAAAAGKTADSLAAGTVAVGTQVVGTWACVAVAAVVLGRHWWWSGRAAAQQDVAVLVCDRYTTSSNYSYCKISARSVLRASKKSSTFCFSWRKTS